MILVNLIPNPLQFRRPDETYEWIPAAILAENAIAPRLALHGEDLTQLPPYSVFHYPLDEMYDTQYLYAVTAFQKLRWPNRTNIYPIVFNKETELYTMTGEFLGTLSMP